MLCSPLLPGSWKSSGSSRHGPHVLPLHSLVGGASIEQSGMQNCCSGVVVMCWVLEAIVALLILGLGAYVGVVDMLMR